jgi:hypothetical protein
MHTLVACAMSFVSCDWHVSSLFFQLIGIAILLFTQQCNVLFLHTSSRRLAPRACLRMAGASGMVTSSSIGSSQVALALSLYGLKARAGHTCLHASLYLAADNTRSEKNVSIPCNALCIPAILCISMLCYSQLHWRCWPAELTGVVVASSIAFP